MRGKLFPFQITKRIYLFSILIVIVPVVLITLVSQVNYYEKEMDQKSDVLYSVARFLDRELEKDFRAILKEKNAENKPRQEQILVINQVLQPEINHLTAAFPEIAMGYYSLELESRVAIGPKFNIEYLKPIPYDSPFRNVYKQGSPLLQKSTSKYIWDDEPILGLSYPIYRNEKIIGHIFASANLTDLYATILKDIVIVGLIGLAVVLLTLTISWNFFRKLNIELEHFSGSVLRGDSKAVDGLLPELNPIIEHVGKHTRELELVVEQLVKEIAKREKVEEELIEVNEKVSGIVESVTDAFFALDKDWRITYINSAAKREISAERGDILGRTLWELFPDDEILLDKLVTAFLAEQNIHIQIYAETMGKWFEITSYVSKEGFGVYFRDITVRKDAEDKIVFQANLLNHVRNAVITTDMEGKVTYFNNYAETLYGWKEVEIIGRDISILKVKPHNLSISCRTLRTILETRGYWEGDLEIVRRDGAIIPVHRIVTLIKNNEGIPIGIISVGIDMAERKKLERDIARLDRMHMVGEMAAGLGHEIRNPMTTVRGFMQLFAAKEDDSLKKEQYKLMIAELDRANSIITEYLSLAKNKKVELQPQSLNTLIKNILPLMQADAMVSDKSIQTQLQDIPDLLMDEKEISQLMINLVRNGLEAMGPGGTVSLKTYMDAGFVVLEVKDEGSGIDPQVIDRLGTPFVTTKESGTGLGLAVSYSIADRNNAKIEYESTAEGTTFFIKFGSSALVYVDVIYRNVV